MLEEEGSPLLQALWRANGTSDGLGDGESHSSFNGLVVLFKVAFIEDGPKNTDA